MKKQVLTVFLSFLLLVPMSVMGQKSGNPDKGRTEYRHDNRGRGQQNKDKVKNNSNNHRGGQQGPGQQQPQTPGQQGQPGKGGQPGNGGHPQGNQIRPEQPNGHAPGVGMNRRYPQERHDYTVLSSMVDRVVRGGRDVNVWQVRPGTYAVKFWRNGRYYVQYLYPEVGRYGDLSRITLLDDGSWYFNDDRDRMYYEDNGSLRISLRGNLLQPWTLIPSIDLNLHF